MNSKQYNPRFSFCLENRIHPKFFDVRRIAIELAFSVLISWVLIFLIRNEQHDAFSLRGISFSALTMVFLSEGIFMFDALISRKYPWHLAMRKRVVILLLFALVWLILVAFTSKSISLFFFRDRSRFDSDGINTALAVFILLTIINVISLIGHNYHIALKKFVIENERLHREKLELDYFALQDQLNPHFLFNNLSTLMALIPQDAIKAEKFARDFTDVYRYVLMSSRIKVINLGREVDFIRAYIDIHQQRLGGGLNVSIYIPEEFLARSVPPLSLQFLVENAIKHNIATEQRPLTISIGVEDEKLCLGNNYQPKSSTYSTNTGLGNLIRRYKYLTSQHQVEIIADDKFFKVKLPLL